MEQLLKLMPVLTATDSVPVCPLLNALTTRPAQGTIRILTQTGDMTAMNEPIILAAPFTCFAVEIINIK